MIKPRCKAGDSCPRRTEPASLLGLGCQPFLWAAAFESNRFSQLIASCVSEKVSATNPRFLATSAAKPFIKGALPTVATLAAIDRLLQYSARARPSSYLSIVDSSPSTDKQSTRIRAKPLSAAASQAFVKTLVASLNDTRPSTVATTIRSSGSTFRSMIRTRAPLGILHASVSSARSRALPTAHPLVGWAPTKRIRRDGDRITES